MFDRLQYFHFYRTSCLGLFQNTHTSNTVCKQSSSVTEALVFNMFELQSLSMCQSIQHYA